MVIEVDLKNLIKKHHFYSINNKLSNFPCGFDYFKAAGYETKFFFSFEGSALVHDLLPINSAFAPGAFFCEENNHMISPVGGSKGAAGCIHQNSPA